MELEMDASTDKHGQSRSRMCASFCLDAGGLQNDYVFNRKGLISDQGQKKEAFSVLQKAYTEKTVGKAN
jgi:hypothetical protein